MKIVSDIGEMQKLSDDLRREGKRIGVVPTMGYLHEGHLSLVRVARREADVVVTTLFVNPTQFAPNEDFSRYPRDLERDRHLLQSAGCDILFTPSNEAIYPPDYSTYVMVERLTALLEGKSRPTHFRGVTTIVAKLFNVVKPHIAVFGQKDAQQAVVIRRMAQDLNFDIRIIVAPIVREPDGLAMSSRNVYLSPEQRAESVVLSQSLAFARRLVEEGDRQPAHIINGMRQLISAKPSAQIDYISVADAESLEELSALHSGGRILVSLAVRFGATRLIDNTLITIP